MNYYPPLGLTRSGVACWWSILRLIETRSPCHLWTLTTKDVLPDSYYGNMHSNLMRSLRDDVRAGLLTPDWGGVRVTEIHPGGHGLHMHWVIAGRIPINLIRRRTVQAGFGRIHVDNRPTTPLVAAYLAKYLSKKHGKLSGIRKWACIGSYAGVKTKDIVFESEASNVFREAYRDAVAAFNAGRAAVAQYYHD